MLVISKVSYKFSIRSVHIRRVHQSVQAHPELITKAFGQPTYETHPHIVPKGHVVPNITAKELWNRRQQLSQVLIDTMRKRHSTIRTHMVVVPSATKCYMSEKIPYIFRQNTDFLYLTGCQEPDTCLVINIQENKDSHQSTLFMRDQDSHSEIWDGPRTGPSDALHFFGVDQALPMREFSDFLQGHCRNIETSLWYDVVNSPQESILSTVKDYVSASRGKIWDSPKNLIHKVRIIKSPAEIELMKKSCDIASAAISKCMLESQPGVSEHHLLATMDYESRIRGAEYLAYPPVIAGGDRATIIHYVNNNQIVNNGEMILMDAGCEFHGYSSDITRTWPVNGIFNKEQRALYEVVLEVQSKIINMLENRVTLDKLFEEMCLVLGKGLQEVGVCKKTSCLQTTIKQAYEFCPHHVSHYLGMDVHDTALINRTVGVRPGMIITVEPGVYINKKANVPNEFRGIGIRIEDDILITEGKPMVLSEKCRKSISDIESLMACRSDKT